MASKVVAKLHAAAKQGNLKVLRELLTAEPADNEPDAAVDLVNKRGADAYTALHFAAEAGKAEACELLVEYGASPTIRNKKGLSAFDLAPNFGLVEGVMVDPVKKRIEEAQERLAQATERKEDASAALDYVVGGQNRATMAAEDVEAQVRRQWRAREGLELQREEFRGELQETLHARAYHEALRRCAEVRAAAAGREAQRMQLLLRKKSQSAVSADKRRQQALLEVAAAHRQYEAATLHLKNKIGIVDVMRGLGATSQAIQMWSVRSMELISSSEADLKFNMGLRDDRELATGADGGGNAGGPGDRLTQAGAVSTLATAMRRFPHDASLQFAAILCAANLARDSEQCRGQIGAGAVLPCCVSSIERFGLKTRTTAFSKDLSLAINGVALLRRLTAMPAGQPAAAAATAAAASNTCLCGAGNNAKLPAAPALPPGLQDRVARAVEAGIDATVVAVLAKFAAITDVQVTCCRLLQILFGYGLQRKLVNKGAARVLRGALHVAGHRAGARELLEALDAVATHGACAGVLAREEVEALRPDAGGGAERDAERGSSGGGHAGGEGGGGRRHRGHRSSSSRRHRQQRGGSNRTESKDPAAAAARSGAVPPLFSILESIRRVATRWSTDPANALRAANLLAHLCGSNELLRVDGRRIGASDAVRRAMGPLQALPPVVHQGDDARASADAQAEALAQACRCLLVIDVPELEQTRLNWIDHLRRNGVVPDGMDGFSLLQFSPALRAGVLNFGQMHGCVFESAARRMSLHAASADPGPLLLYLCNTLHARKGHPGVVIAVCQCLSQVVTVWGAEAILPFLDPDTVKAVIAANHGQDAVLIAVRRLMHEVESCFD